MAKHYLLTENDRQFLNKLHAMFRGNKLTPVSRASWSREEDHQAPETYVAKTRSEGLPARSGDSPGTAICEIYQILGIDSPTLRACAFSKRIYNLSETEVASNTFFSVTRTKYGPWLANLSSASTNIRWGRATVATSAWTPTPISIYSGRPPTAPFNPDPSLDTGDDVQCIPTSSILEGVPGLIIPVPTFDAETDLGPASAPYEFRPFVQHFLVTAMEDWNPGSAFQVGLAGGQGPVAQNFNAIAPNIPGEAMDGVEGLVVPITNQGANWQFIPLGCSGVTGTGSGSV